MMIIYMYLCSIQVCLLHVNIHKVKMKMKMKSKTVNQYYHVSKRETPRVLYIQELEANIE